MSRWEVTTLLQSDGERIERISGSPETVFDEAHLLLLQAEEDAESNRLGLVSRMYISYNTHARRHPHGLLL